MKKVNLTKRYSIQGLLELNLSNSEISRRLSVTRKLVADVKKHGPEKKRKVRFDKRKSRKINEELGKKMEKMLKGKRGVGIKKLGLKLDLSSPTIRRWLKTKPWGQYLTVKKKPGLSKK